MCMFMCMFMFMFMILCFNPLSKGNKALNSVRKTGSIINENAAWRVDGAVFQDFKEKNKNSCLIIDPVFLPKKRMRTSENCLFLRLWGETVESGGIVFARSFRPALCPVSWLRVVRALGHLRSRSFLVSGAGCEGAGRAGRCAAAEARP